MADESVYKEYVSSEDFMSSYLAYQERYVRQVRESDKVVIGIVARLVDELARDPVIVDIGCSTGNLLRHIKGSLPVGTLVGAEFSDASLEACRNDPELADIEFLKRDVVNLGDVDRFDIAVVNAVLYMLNASEFEQALRGLAKSIRPGGALVVFDFFHHFPQDLAIRETSASHPDGLMLHFRPMAQVEALLRDAGFTSTEFSPFEIPIDLERGQHLDVGGAFEELNSYTVRAEGGARLLFRGALFQPWCHLVARMPGDR